MSRRRYLRIFGEFGSLAALEVAGLYAMSHWRVMETLLAPGPHSVKPYLALAICFVMLRFFLLLVAPGWLLARLYLARTAPIQGAGAGSATEPSTPALSTTIETT